MMAFFPCLQNDFVAWDDRTNYLENPFYRGLGPPQLRWAWTSFHLGVYQPLAWMMLGAEYLAVGLEPRRYHLVSLVFYALDTVVLFLLTVMLLVRSRAGSARNEPWRLTLSAFLAVALFAVHPLRVEVVAWASCQPYLPCALFSMLAVMAYVHAHPPAGECRLGWLVATFFLLLAALLSKAVAVSVPVVLLLIDIYPLRRLGGGPGRWFGPEARKVWWEKVPFATLSLVFIGLAILGRVQARHLVPMQVAGVGARIAQSCYGICFYLVKTMVPRDLTAYYPVPKPFIWYQTPFILSMLAALVTSAVVFCLRRSWPALLIVWLVYLAVLAPNLGLVRFGTEIAADRYSYIAMMGAVVLLAGGLSAALDARRHARLVAAGTIAVSLAALGGLILLCRAQTRTWRSSETLWTHALGHGRDWNDIPHVNLGAYFLEHGQLDAARVQFEEALRINPRMEDAHNNLGLLHWRQGRMGEARAHFEEALRIDPRMEHAHMNMGTLHWREGRLGEARPHFEEVLQANPDSWVAHGSLASVLAQQGQFGPARRHFETALAINPRSAPHRDGLGVLLKTQGLLAEARAELEQALRIDPRLAKAHLDLGVVFAELGQPDRAQAEFDEAIRLKPDYTAARIERGLFLFRRGRTGDARAELEETLRLDARSVAAHNCLGQVLKSQGRLAEARAQFEEVLKLKPDSIEGHANLGGLLLEQGALDGAIAHLDEAMRQNSGDPAVYNNRAMIWATAPDARLRDGRQAVAAATRACTLTDWKNAFYIDTCAAAHAEAADFDEAVKLQNRAITLATSEHTREDFRSRLRLYQAKQPYREQLAR
jgi:Tfp pilus assembly protein PilF